MPRPRHYVPCISRNIVGALYHEAKARRLPMTRLVDELLTGVLQGTPGWRLAHPKTFVVQENPEPRSDHPITTG